MAAGASGHAVLLQRDDLLAGLGQVEGARKAAQARAHDHDVGLLVPGRGRLDGRDGLGVGAGHAGHERVLA